MINLELPIRDPKLILQFIPQRDPIVMVSGVLDFTDNFVKSEFKIESDNLFVHKDDFTEAGLIEHMAQSVALHTGISFHIKNLVPPTGYIGSIKTVEIFTLPKINQTISTDVTILHEIMGVTMVKTICKYKDQILASAEMKTVIAPN
jgi:3-hydroxyacyl-[acyl-carrier-protein] dehydratase